MVSAYGLELLKSPNFPKFGLHRGLYNGPVYGLAIPLVFCLVRIVQYGRTVFDRYVAKYSQNKSFAHRYGGLEAKTRENRAFLT